MSDGQTSIAISYGLSASASAAQNSDSLKRVIADYAGQAIYIPAGIYEINPLTIVVPDTHLRFEPGAVFKVASSSVHQPSLVNIAADNVTIDGGEFDGSDRTGVYGVMAIRITGSSSHIRIRNCVVRNASAGIGSYVAANATDWLIEGCTIDTIIKEHGIYLHGHLKDNLAITGVRVLNNRISGIASNGVWIGNKFSDVVVSGNYIADCGRMGIEAWSNPEGNFVIADNIIVDCQSFGVSIAGTPHVICTGNHITRPMHYGIEIANSRFITLANNHITDVRSKETGSKSMGIVLTATKADLLSDIAISGGIITGAMSGINLCGGAALRSNIAISGVVIDDCTYGIRNVGNIAEGDGGGPVEDITIVGCVIHAARVGIGNSIQGGVLRGGVISANNIHVEGGNGISLFRPAEMAITSNRFRGESKPGFTCIRILDHDEGSNQGHDILIADNLIVGFEWAHFYSPLIAKEVNKSG